MPTFTLLGQVVLRLPFIKATSLGHEILHSWFGNAIDVDLSQGNWCEGLTSYLADHAFRQDKGEGAAYRKESILNYLSYINAENVIPLSAFTNAGHSQPLARARRAVGYSRSLMLFHELHQLIGHESFMRALRAFYANFRGKTASWQDIEHTFATASGRDLSTFFHQRLTRTDIPWLAADQIGISHEGDSSILHFQLHQKTATPYCLAVPIRVSTPSGSFDFIRPIDGASAEIRLTTAERPLKFTIDPDYSMLRRLAPSETPPIWSHFLGSRHKLVVIASKAVLPIYAPVLERLRQNDWQVKFDDEVKNAELADRDLLFLGLDQRTSRSLFALPPHPDHGFTLDVRHNPLNRDRVAVLISSANASESRAVAGRLSHYGKYSLLHFEGGKIAQESIAPSASGEVYQLETLPEGGSTAPLADFSAIVGKLSTDDIVYIGESHTSVGDHRLQLRLIEALAQRSPQLAIGMEMFPATSQEALDRYVLGDGAMTEKEFLKASHYFKVWGFDWRLFREIFQFARRHKTPVIGLNLDRSIVSSVFAHGDTDKLPPNTLADLPKNRDLDMPGYSGRLRAMHSIHEQDHISMGSLGGFIQAQALWDETMARNIARYLHQHSGTKMIVLAGSEHTRKDSGIPPRVARRIDVRQASVLNVLDGSAPTNLAEIADYFFLEEPMELPEAGKLGIIVQEEQRTEGPRLTIIDFIPGSKGPEAGLKKGDELLAVNRYPIKEMEDIRIAMLDVRPGTAIPVQVERSGENGAQREELSVQLIQADQTGPHP